MSDNQKPTKPSPARTTASDLLGTAAVNAVMISGAPNTVRLVLDLGDEERIAVLVLRGSGDRDELRASFEEAMRQLGERTDPAPSLTEMLHPTGRCICFGEGRCKWCRTLCDKGCPSPRALACCDHGFPHVDDPRARFAVGDGE